MSLTLTPAGPDRSVPDTALDVEHSRGTRRPTPRWARWAILTLVFIVGLGVRWYFLDRQTLDYQNFLSRWYDTLDQRGFGAFREQFADYNYPYLYLIWGLTILHVPSLIGIKALSITFDVVLAALAYRIVALRTDRFSLRALAFGIVFLLPSVIMNSAWWGQADAIYTACVVAGIYFLLRAQSGGARRGEPGHRAYVWNSVFACACFGLAFGFKLQAVFVFPVLLWLLIRRRLPWSSLLAVPVVYLLLDVPAVLAGASWSTALSVYLNQTGSYKQLTLGAANLYQLIPISGDATWVAHLGVGLAALVVVVFLVWSVWRKPSVTATSILVTATASAAIVPFLLPAMHDRYFFTVEILSVVAAFFLPLWFVAIPVLIQASAIGVYHSSLTGDQGRGMGFGGQHGFGGRQDGAGAPSSGPGGSGSGGGWNGSTSRGVTGGPGDPHGGGGPGGGGPSGGHGGRGADGYTSGRGDTALTVYASFMAAAVVGLICTAVRVVGVRPGNRAH